MSAVDFFALRVRIELLEAWIAEHEAALAGIPRWRLRARAEHRRARREAAAEAEALAAELDRRWPA